MRNSKLLDLILAFLLLSLICVGITGCAISTTYGRRPKPVTGRPNTYQITMYKNAFETDAGADRKADAHVKKLLAETGCNDYKVVRVVRVNRLTNKNTYTVRVFKTDIPSSLSLAERINSQEEARRDTAISAFVKGTNVTGRLQETKHNVSVITQNKFLIPTRKELDAGATWLARVGNVRVDHYGYDVEDPTKTVHLLSSEIVCEIQRHFEKVDSERTNMIRIDGKWFGPWQLELTKVCIFGINEQQFYKQLRAYLANSLASERQNGGTNQDNTEGRLRRLYPLNSPANQPHETQTNLTDMEAFVLTLLEARPNERDIVETLFQRRESCVVGLFAAWGDEEDVTSDGLVHLQANKRLRTRIVSQEGKHRLLHTGEVDWENVLVFSPDPSRKLQMDPHPFIRPDSISYW